jgi:V-type H+-transporting ATPase subunit F
MAQLKTKGTLLVSVIADATTVTGLLLTGIGERNAKGEQNFMIVDRDTTDAMIEAQMKQLIDRDDIGVILISQNVAERVRQLIVNHEKLFPTILEIPSKDNPYDPEKDTIVLRAAAILWGSDAGSDKLKEMQGKQ